ncbi:class I SAM-dependent DNA methyltransferase [Nocardia sp. NPDC059691]|uniref:class I SAM-dependent DNA methyltransferase n=1 Tax=Nocardia sp. NPDC059691 TaxID=3346908 RepID=UPI00369EBEC3
MTVPEYEELAEVYDRWTASNDYESWCDYIQRRIPPSAQVLDACCGTGTMMRLLQSRGFSVAGVDGSAAMLGRAASSLEPGTLLWQQDLSRPGAPPTTFDALICCFDSVNYFVADDGLDALFSFAAGAVRPGGRFLFDVNTEHKLAEIFGNSHYGDDLGQFAYVWRNRYDPDQRRVQFLISLFIEGDGAYHRHEIHHVQRWFPHDTLLSAAAAHGFDLVEVCDDYSDRPVGIGTLRETWVLTRR